jgi:hypothetical protein
VPVPGPDPGIVAGIHVFLAASLSSPAVWEGREGAGVDGRDKPGHDDAVKAAGVNVARRQDIPTRISS